MLPRAFLVFVFATATVLAQDPKPTEPAPTPPAAPAEPAPNAAIVPVPRGADWLVRHEKINAEVKAHRDACDLVFIGDSITQSWEGGGKDVWAKRYAARKAVNLGISGDRTEHVLWRFENGNLEGITPKLAVVMIGTNNFGHGTSQPEQVLEGVHAVVARLRERAPATSILLLGIFPRGEHMNPMRGNILQVNQALARLHDGEHVHFLDIGSTFVEDDGSIGKDVMPDALHLTPEGYRRWADAIEPTVARLLGETTRK